MPFTEESREVSGSRETQEDISEVATCVGAQQVRKQLVGFYTGGGYSLNMTNLAKAHTEMYPLLRNSKMWDF